VTREIERSRPGSWVGALFDYHPPQIGFSRGEQKQLLSALSGGTDKEVHDDLGASLSTVKNTWRSIYNRAALRLPELFLDHSKTDVRSSERGKEKNATF
jgi:DNA-binding NarL/FixJ family response regulator